MNQILVLDSDQDMVEMLTSWLRTRGYTVGFSYSADKARAAWLERKPDLVIAEVNLPGVDVLAMCRELQTRHDALVLAVTEDSSAKIEAYCLESGADAFLAKPFLPKSLLAHIHSLSRRARSTLQRQPSSMYIVGPVRFDASRNEVRVNGKVAHLTPTEGRIFQLLAANAGDVCSQGQIVSHAWGYAEDGDTYLIKAHIRKLREKIEPVPSKPRFIRTVPGVGYTLSVSSSPDSEEDSRDFGPEHEHDRADATDDMEDDNPSHRLADTNLREIRMTTTR